jgi:two-component system response regulator DevR
MGIRVFHCDDSEAFTRLVAFWLAEHGDIEHVGAAHTADAALADLPGSRPDIVLLDTMGDPGDNTLLHAIRATVPDAAVIVYSGYVRLMQEGALGDAADGYLSKSDEEDELVATIRSVAVHRLGD